MWDFFKTVRHRHSVRCYDTGRPIEKEKLHAILEMACAAPSAGDLQSYHITVCNRPEQIKALGEASRGQEFVGDAPLCLIFCTDSERAEHKYGARGRDLYALQDATIAATYAQLAAVAAGLGSAWVGAFDEAKIAAIVGLDSGLTPVALLPLGYPAESPPPTPRRPLDEVVSYT